MVTGSWQMNHRIHDLNKLSVLFFLFDTLFGIALFELYYFTSIFKDYRMVGYP